MILINGERRDSIASADRGFQYGDGLFETIEICNHQAVFLERHLKRLNTACPRLLLPLPDNELLRADIATLLRHSTSDKAVLKIILTRGCGGRGYRQPEPIQPNRVLSLHPFPDYPLSYSTHGIQARFCHTRLGLNPALAGIKHLNRLEQVLARAEWNAPDIQEGIVLDSNDYVIEGTMSNLFYVRNQCLYTAELSQSGVAGIMRDVLIELAEQNAIPVTIHRYSKQDLLSAEEIFVCNCLIGLWRVRQIEQTTFAIHDNTLSASLQRYLAEYKANA